MRVDTLITETQVLKSGHAGIDTRRLFSSMETNVVSGAMENYSSRISITGSTDT
jgi:hypothetical protein